MLNYSHQEVLSVQRALWTLAHPECFALQPGMPISLVLLSPYYLCGIMWEVHARSCFLVVLTANQEKLL